jgi:hypothetical protein
MKFHENPSRDFKVAMRGQTDGQMLFGKDDTGHICNFSLELHREKKGGWEGRGGDMTYWELGSV